MPPSLTLPAPAKLNLFLHITGRRADGYHLLQTLFVFLDWGDRITLHLREDGQITRPQGATGVAAEHDLTVRAARLLQQATACPWGADIYVDKRIPLGGGLGGGSSNAATVLHGLNHLWGCGWDDTALAELGLRLGADVPVFVHGHAAWAEGVGEILTPVTLPPQWYVVLHPRVHVPTAALFADPDLTRDCIPITLAAFRAGQGSNVFEPVVARRYSEVAQALQWLSQYAPARLTGSGSCLFAAAADQASATRIVAQVPAGWFGFAAQSATISPLRQQLAVLQQQDR